MRKVSWGVVGLVLFGLVGCGSSKPKDMIVGKWQCKKTAMGMDMTATLEFTKDGEIKGVVEFDKKSMKKARGMAENRGKIPENFPDKLSVTGKYKFIDDNNFESELTIGTGPEKDKGKIESITKEKMVIISEKGEKEEWTRVP